MSQFKNQLAADVDNVFFSAREEFWDTHNINGVDMRVQLDGDELIKRSSPKVYNASDTGLYKERRLIFVRASEYGDRPAVGSVITFDGKRRRVADVDTQAGVYIIELEGNKT